jgi:hypothetical protein
MVLPQFLDGQVHQAARPDGPAHIGQHARPVFGRDVLHRVDGQDRVELAGIRQVLQRYALEGEGDAPRPGPGQHARRLVSARDPVAGRRQHRKILARPARRIQHSPAGRDQTQHPGHPVPLHVPGILLVAIGGRLGVPGDGKRRPPSSQPHLPLHAAPQPPRRPAPRRQRDHPAGAPGQGLNSPRGSYSLGLSQDHRQGRSPQAPRPKSRGPTAGKPGTRR